MKRKYPKTKGMAVIFEKQRFNRALDTEVFREIHRRHLRGEKITRIIDDMIHGETYGSKMTHKEEESWRKSYYKKHPSRDKSVSTVNCEFNSINISRNAPSKSFIRKGAKILLMRIYIS